MNDKKVSRSEGVSLLDDALEMGESVVRLARKTALVIGSGSGFGAVIAATFEHVASLTGPLDIVVNNAGWTHSLTEAACACC